MTTIPVPVTVRRAGLDALLPSARGDGSGSHRELSARSRAMALASLALGVVALLLSPVPLIGVVALIAGTAALALGVAVVRRPGVGLLAQCLAVAGAVLGGLGLLMSLIVLLVLAPVMTTAPSLEEHLVVVEVQVAEG